EVPLFRISGVPIERLRVERHASIRGSDWRKREADAGKDRSRVLRDARNVAGIFLRKRGHDRRMEDSKAAPDHSALRGERRVGKPEAWSEVIDRRAENRCTGRSQLARAGIV